MALRDVGSLGVSRATPDASSALSLSPSHNLNSPSQIGETGTLLGGKSSTAWEEGGRMVKRLFIPQVPATSQYACALKQRTGTRSSFTFAPAQSSISPQATAHYLARGMGLGNDGWGGWRQGARLCLLNAWGRKEGRLTRLGLPQATKPGYRN